MGGTCVLGCRFPKWNPTVIWSKKWDSTSLVVLHTQGGKILTDLTIIPCGAAIINPWFSWQFLQIKGDFLPTLAPLLILCKFPDLETWHFLVHTHAHFSSPPWVLSGICTDRKMAQRREAVPTQRKCKKHSLVRMVSLSYSPFTTSIYSSIHFKCLHSCIASSIGYPAPLLPRTANWKIPSCFHRGRIQGCLKKPPDSSISFPLLFERKGDKIGS